MILVENISGFLAYITPLFHFMGIDFSFHNGLFCEVKFSTGPNFTSP